MTGTPALPKIPATLIPGDGIGPEITAAVVAILDAAGAPFEWDVQQGGLPAIKEHGDPLPQRLLASIRRTRLALKDPLTTPVGGGFRSVNVRLREDNIRTGDLGGKATTKEYAAAIARRLAA